MRSTIGFFSMGLGALWLLPHLTKSAPYLTSTSKTPDPTPRPTRVPRRVQMRSSILRLAWIAVAWWPGRSRNSISPPSMWSRRCLGVRSAGRRDGRFRALSLGGRARIARRTGPWGVTEGYGGTGQELVDGNGIQQGTCSIQSISVTE